ncbi:MAG: Gfo/Idh/MocA family oxidoreductase [Planctomycetota bacterium]
MPSLTRRSFLKSTAATMSAAYVLPAISWGRVQGANERLQFAVIGTGGMGTGHVHDLVGRRERDNIGVARVCDVYRRRLLNAVKAIEGDEHSGTMEYREVLDDKSVDAIVIATPDHWHTKIAIEAMEAGKDVYCEKPLSLTVEQAIDCRNAVRRTKRTLQVGPQRTSEDKYWKARDVIAQNKIGKVIWSQASYCRNSREGQFNWPIDADAGPNQPKEAEGYVWWDRWLGHEWGLAPRIDWNADHFFRFRKYWAYNGGVATDLLYHFLAPLLLSITGPDGEYPRRVVSAGGKYVEKDERDIPDTFMMMVDYPSEHTIVLISVMTNDGGTQTVIRGQRGTIELGDNLTVREQADWWPEFRKANDGLVPNRMVQNDKGEQHPEPAPGGASYTVFANTRRDHMGNFIDSVRGLDKPNCNVELGASTMAAIKMGVEAYRRNKVMVWDAAAERMREG